MKLIDKFALVAEIEKRMLRYEQERKTEPAYYDGLYTALEDLRDDFINTLEVKEVDLENEIDNIWNSCFNRGWDDNSLLSINHKGFEYIAKRFFELGIKVAQKGE